MPVLSIQIESYHKKFLQKLYGIEVLNLDDERFQFLRCVVSKPRRVAPAGRDMKLKAPASLHVIITDSMVLRMKYFAYEENRREFNNRIDQLFRQYFMLHMSEVLLYNTPESENKLFEFIGRFDLTAHDGITFSALYKYYQRHRGHFNIDKCQNWGWKTHEPKKK